MLGPTAVDAAGMRTVQCAYVVLLFSRMAEPYQTLYTTCSPTHGLYTHGPVQSPSLLYKKCKRLVMFNCPEVVLCTQRVDVRDWRRTWTPSPAIFSQSFDAISRKSTSKKASEIAKLQSSNRLLKFSARGVACSMSFSNGFGARGGAGLRAHPASALPRSMPAFSGLARPF